jgi:Xaa-Pro aminopeptidase
LSCADTATLPFKDPLMTAAPSVFAQRIASAQSALTQAGLAALLVPSSDPHLSEYLPERWQGRQWLSGFTGSMGTLVITPTEAALFADSRYWTQAENELAGSGIALVKIDTGASIHHVQWLSERLRAGQTACVDAQVLSLAAHQQLQQALTKVGASLRTDLDLLDTIWPERAGLPGAPIYEHDPYWAPTPRSTKLAQVRAAMATQGASHHLISTVDDIAWLFNLRGSDVTYNPVFLAHALIDARQATMFIAPGKVTPALTARLQAESIVLGDYAQASATLAALPTDAVLLLDPRRVTLGLRNSVPQAVKVLEVINPSVFLKSRKSADEAVHVRHAMEQDGAAMCEFYAWFEATQGHERITELTIDERLSAARAKRPGFVGLSFSTIAGFNGNGAMPHYRATPEHHAVIEGNGLLLIDSGGQYLGGTTDITRVWPIGTPTAQQRRDYTRVLKGTMALSRTHFPVGTLSPMLDAIARQPLWEAGLDFSHGTGHGVGYFLNVHEGPQSISRAMPEASMAMQQGMITSIEPGLYRVGQWGIRIENLVLNVPASTREAFGDFLAFETLTLCPIDTRCIDMSLLREDEINWINSYHTTVRERLQPLVGDAALAWLLARTEPI